MSAQIIALNAPSTPALTPSAAYLASLAVGSRAGQASALRTVAAILGRDADERLTYADAVMVRGALLEGFTPAYARKVLCALRGVAREARKLGLGDAESLRAVEEIEGVKGGARFAGGRDLSDDERAALALACEDGTVCGVRDAVALALMLAVGLRRAEVASLQLADLALTTEGGTVTVAGKGERVRRIAIPRDLAGPLARYAQIRGDAPGPLVCAVTRGDRLTSDGISGDAIYQILAKRAALAGVTEVRPHDCRRTVATRLLDAGHDLGVVAAILGHASTDTSRRYDMREERRARDALLTLDTNSANRANV